MRRGRIFLFLILIVVVGLALLYFAYTQFLAGGGPQVTPAAPLTEVYYAAQNIPQGTTITEEMLGTFSIPPENVADVMFTRGEENALVGQAARFSLEQGVIITSSMVGDAPAEIAGPAWAVNIPQGMVAAAIPTNRLSLLGYGVADGAHVNVNACMLFVDVDPAFQTVLPNFTSVLTGTGFIENQLPVLSVSAVSAEQASRQGRVELDPTLQQPFYAVPSEQQRPRLVCQMILQDVVVLKLGNFETQAPSTDDPNATPSPAQAQQQVSPDIVTLMVNPQDSISLNYFVYSGATLSLSLRNPNDTSRFAAEAATLTSLLTQYNISLPSKLPYATQPRIDILTPPLLPNDAVTVQPQQQ
ncbi:MAG TPA: SAF domain-containing protein [Anaerolineales bacterium]|jgi:pilus assembly protein CpaB|nr:SAF domain-containing protein [Anaerolineales bacterium]